MDCSIKGNFVGIVILIHSYCIYSQIFEIAYCRNYDPSKITVWKNICQEFVNAVSEHRPAMLKKQKVHLMLHLVDCMEEFGPISAFNTER